MEKRRYESEPGTLNLFTKADLDKMTVGIEFTLISLAQGLALAQLASSSIEPLVTFQFTTWPYILAGLTIVLYSWANAITHALGFINWPLSLRHNFMYFIFMLIEVGMFSQITVPANWFALSFVFWAVGWGFCYIDLGLIKRREPDFITPTQKALCCELMADHKSALRLLMPLGMAYMLLSWFLIRTYPGIFLDQNWHLALISGQVIIGCILVARSIRDFHRHGDLMCNIKSPHY